MNKVSYRCIFSSSVITVLTNLRHMAKMLSKALETEIKNYGINTVKTSRHKNIIIIIYYDYLQRYTTLSSRNILQFHHCTSDHFSSKQHNLQNLLAKIHYILLRIKYSLLRVPKPAKHAGKIKERLMQPRNLIPKRNATTTSPYARRSLLPP